MSSYVFIENYSKLGKMAISKSVFEQIVHEVTDSIIDRKNKSKKISLCKQPDINIRNGSVLVSVQVNILHGENVTELCLELQERIANVLTALTEMVPFKIDVKVNNIK